MFKVIYISFLFNKLIAKPTEGARGNRLHKSQNFEQNQNFLGNDRKNLSKMKNFKAATRNCLGKAIFLCIENDHLMQKMFKA